MSYVITSYVNGSIEFVRGVSKQQTDKGISVSVEFTDDLKKAVNFDSYDLAMFYITGLFDTLREAVEIRNIDKHLNFSIQEVFIFKK